MARTPSLSRAQFLAGAFIAVTLPFAGGCSSLGQGASNGSEQAPGGSAAVSGGDVAGSHLVFIGDNNFKPYRYTQTADDGAQTTVGLDIAVADELARRLGFTYEFQPMSFSGTLPAIQNHQADFSMSLASNPEREETFDFT